MIVKQLLDNFIGSLSNIVVFENDNKVENFSDKPAASCLEKYGWRYVSEWYYVCESNELNINMKQRCKKL